MAFINWDSHLSIGIPAMDHQHKKMADIINQFHAGVRSGIEVEKLALLLTALTQVTTAHLEEEEQLMDKAGFPHLDGHKHGHEKILEQLALMQKKLDDGTKPSLTETAVFFKNWFISHIQKDDRDLGVYLYNTLRELKNEAAHSDKVKKEEPVK
jgi:hemerythrin